MIKPEGKNNKSQLISSDWPSDSSSSLCPDASELSLSCGVSSTCMHRKQINGVPVAITPSCSYCHSSTSQSWLKLSSG